MFGIVQEWIIGGFGLGLQVIAILRYQDFITPT